MSGRRKVERETSEYAAMLRRLVRRWGERVAQESEVDLAQMVAMRDHLEAAIEVAVQGQVYDLGQSWSYVAAGLGVTKQTAWERYHRTPSVTSDAAAS